jgi:hypothetical protein
VLGRLGELDAGAEQPGVDAQLLAEGVHLDQSL